MSRPKKSSPAVTTRQLPAYTTPAGYDPTRHCGSPTARDGNCTLLKGHGTSHPGEGYCSRHGGTKDAPGSVYAHIKRNRLKYLIERVRNSDMDPLDILGELEVMRALAIGFLEDHANLDDGEDVAKASDLLDRIMKAAFLYQKMRQSDMLHIKVVELLHMRMADVMMRVIEQLDPAIASDWKQQAITRIRDQWGRIQIETSPMELKRVFEQEAELIEENR